MLLWTKKVIPSSQAFTTIYYKKHIHLLQKVQSNRRKYVDWKIRLDIFDLTTTPTEADILNGIWGRFQLMADYKMFTRNVFL